MNNTKMIVPFTCPHCKMDAMLEMGNVTPELVAVITNKDILEAKQALLTKVETLPLPSEEITEIRGRITDPDFIVTPTDVDVTLTQIIYEFSSKKDNTE